MAEENGSGDTPNPNPNPNPSPTPAPSGSAPASRPEYLPEQFWDDTKGAPNVEGLARAYTEQRHRHAKGKEGLIPVIKQELEAERLKGRPEKPDGYTFDVKEGTQLPNNLVMLKEPPGKDFTPEPGKRYFWLKPDDPLMGMWRDMAHKAGFSQDDFMAGLVTYADKMAQVTPTPEAAAKARNDAIAAEVAKLGEHGQQRIVHTFNGLKALIGEQHAMTLDSLPLTASHIEAIEALVEKAGGPKFMPQGGGSGDGGGMPTMADVRQLQGDADYWESPIKQEKVRGMLAKINAGKRGRAA